MTRAIAGGTAPALAGDTISNLFGGAHTPETPATQAASSPTASEGPTTLTATTSEILAPYKVRERISRPSSSVPNQCATDGPINRPVKSSCAGSCGASHGANTAQTTKTVSRTIPTAARGCLLTTPPIGRLSPAPAFAVTISNL